MAVKTKRGPKKRKAKPADKPHKKKADKQNPDVEAQLDHIRKLQRVADAAIKEADEAKKTSRNKQGVANAAIKAVSEAIHETAKPGLYTDSTVKAVKKANALPPADDDSWREVKIDTLTIDGKPIKTRIIKALNAANILTLGDYIVPQLVSSKQFIGNVVFANVGVANNLPLAAAFATVPVVVMILYLLGARRVGAFESL